MATQLAHTDQAQSNPLMVLRSQLEQRAAEFKMVLPSHISPDKLQRTILTAVQANPDLLGCDRRSFMTSAFKAAQDGLLPDGREAALVQFNTRQKIDGQWQSVKLAQYMPMVFGLRKKILQSDEVVDLFATVVYRQEIEAGRFIYEEGTERMLRHKPLLDPDFSPTDDDIALAYSVATFKDGSKSFEVMPRRDINKIREASQTGATRDRNGQPREAKGPWADWFAEMAKKSVIRRHSKSLPMSSDVLVDVEGEDLDHATRSAAALLSIPGGQPQVIEDQTDEIDHDPTTGEIIEAEVTDEVQQNTQEASGTARKAPGAASSGAAMSDTVGASTNSTEADDGASDDGPASNDSPAQAQVDDDSPHPAWAKTNEIIGEVRAALAIMDVNSIESRNRADIEAMPDDIAADVRKMIEARRNEITKAREDAKAKDGAQG